MPHPDPVQSRYTLAFSLLFLEPAEPPTSTSFHLDGLAVSSCPPE